VLCTLKVVDADTRQILGPEENGEILVKSPMLMAGYWRNPHATRASFDEDGWFKTGQFIERTHVNWQNANVC
jgi:long-subunit acyl-CoA synthetase (AMP-forming)